MAEIDRYNPFHCWVLKDESIDDAVYFEGSLTPWSCPGQDEQITIMQFHFVFIFSFWMLLHAFYVVSTVNGVVKFISRLMLLLR